MTKLKLQSAMEYLLTYGWAILVIATVAVTLFALGTFGSPSSGSSSCVPQTGFLCTTLSFSANVANLYDDPSISAQVGSASGPWTGVYYIIVPQGQVLSNTISCGFSCAPNNFWYWGTLYGQYFYSPSVGAGQTTNIKVYISPSYPGVTTIQLGTHLSGTIWAMYTTPAAANQVVQIASFSAVATTS